MVVVLIIIILIIVISTIAFNIIGFQLPPHHTSESLVELFKHDYT